MDCPTTMSYRYYVPDHHRFVHKLMKLWDKNTGFPNWVHEYFHADIYYHYHSTVIDYVEFHNEKDLNWFLLQL